MQTIEDLFKVALIGKVINKCEIISVSELCPWDIDSRDSYCYGNSSGLSISCKVKVFDNRAKLGYRIESRTFDMEDYIQ